MDVRRKRLKFQAWHRGMRELDLLLGYFSDAHLETLSDRQLDEFESLLDCPDQTIFAWYTGREQVPSEHDTSVFRLLKSFELSARMT